MRIGILGGSFDPVHYGHLLIAESAREQLSLDQVRFTPAGDPPHKPGQPLTEPRRRLEMLELAISGCEKFTVDPRELHRKGPSFTVDTLHELRAEAPNDEFYFLLGADSLRDLLTWREPRTIAELATLAVCNRPGVAAPDRNQIRQWVGPEIADRVVLVDMPGVDLSATELRDRAASGRSLRFLTPRAVEAYIQQHGLYQSSTT